MVPNYKCSVVDFTGDTAGGDRGKLRGGGAVELTHEGVEAAGSERTEVWSSHWWS